MTFIHTFAFVFTVSVRITAVLCAFSADMMSTTRSTPDVKHRADSDLHAPRQKKVKILAPNATKYVYELFHLDSKFIPVSQDFRKSIYDTRLMYEVNLIGRLFRTNRKWQLMNDKKNGRINTYLQIRREIEEDSQQKRAAKRALGKKKKKTADEKEMEYNMNLAFEKDIQVMSNDTTSAWFGWQDRDGDQHPVVPFMPIYGDERLFRTIAVWERKDAHYDAYFKEEDRVAGLLAKSKNTSRSCRENRAGLDTMRLFYTFIPGYR